MEWGGVARFGGRIELCATGCDVAEYSRTRMGGRAYRTLETMATMTRCCSKFSTVLWSSCESQMKGITI